jgi:glutamate synthase domain-containing protein 1
MSQALPPYTFPRSLRRKPPSRLEARTTGAPGHDIIRLALELLAGLEHRSYLGAAGQSGAGLLIQIPHALLATEIADLPAPGDYAVGTVFLPRANITGAVNLTEKILGQVLTQALPSAPVRPNGGAAALTFEIAPVDPARFLQWRAVPINPALLGEAAAKTCPEIRQIIIRRPAGIAPGETFERLLFAARQKLVAVIRNVGMKGFFIPSLSARTVVYKGLVRPSLLADFYPDLTRPACQSALGVVHTGHRAHLTWGDVQPLRLLAHHGYLNTIQGNQNWLLARESTLDSPYWAEGIRELHPLVEPQGSAAAHLANALELLTRSGRDIHHALAMLVPEAWESMLDIPPDRRAFYRYHAALMEPWDGPAALIFTDGRRVGAALDRNGLRPLRYLTTSTHLVIAASEAGAVKVDEGLITTKGKLGPGQMILVDMNRQVFLANDQVKNELARRSHYQTWVSGFNPLTTETARPDSTPPRRPATSPRQKSIPTAMAHSISGRLWLHHRGNHPDFAPNGPQR